MGRHRTNLSRLFFTYIAEEKKNICNICDTSIIGDHAANLERHLKRFHDSEYSIVQANKKTTCNVKNEFSPSTSNFKMRQQKSLSLDKISKLKVELNKETVLNACVELVTVNGCSFKVLEYSGFMKILNPIVTAIGDDFSVNSESIKSLIPESAFKIVSQINDVIDKKVFSLKLDIVSQLSRSILGFHAQLIIDGKVHLLTLGMMEMKDMPTEIYIKNMLEKILDKYNIDIQQIYSVTTDDSTNMVPYMNLLDELENDNSVNSVDHISFFTGEGSIAFNNIIGVSCVAHILQQAVTDAFKSDDLNDLVFDARELVKKLRSPSLMQNFEDENLTRPVLDYPSGWNNTYNMFKSLLDCKEFSLTLAESNLNFYYPQNKWVKLKLVVDSLQPLVEATLKFQNEQLSLSDFYGIWLQCKIKLGNMKNFFSNILYNELRKREANLLDNDSLLGAIYLDPRFQILLSESQKLQAIDHLKSIWNKIQLLESSLLFQEDTTSTNDFSLENSNELEEYLKSKEKALDKKANIFQTQSSLNIAIDTHLNSFNNIPRIDSKKQILEYWEENKTVHPYLYKIAMVVLATPATQISLKRVFSGLKFILQDTKCNLSENILEDIFLIKANFDQFPLL